MLMRSYYIRVLVLHVLSRLARLLVKPPLLVVTPGSGLLELDGATYRGIETELTLWSTL